MLVLKRRSKSWSGEKSRMLLPEHAKSEKFGFSKTFYKDLMILKQKTREMKL